MNVGEGNIGKSRTEEDRKVRGEIGRKGEREEKRRRKGKGEKEEDQKNRKSIV